MEFFAQAMKIRTMLWIFQVSVTDEIKNVN